MIKVTKEFIENNRLFDGIHRVTLGLSGGADSMCLLHFMNTYYSEIELIIAHFDHKLRDCSGDEAIFCRNIADEMGLAFYLGSADVLEYSKVHKLSLEEAARILRYDFLYDVREKSQSDVILTAHHLNDNGETIIGNMLRGCGIQGLSGISPRANYLIRPLLHTDKDQILEYCLENDIVYVDDVSNLDVKYKRNSIRHELLPMMQKYNPSLNQGLSRLADVIREDNDYLLELTNKYYNDIVMCQEKQIVIDLDKLSYLHLAMKRRVIRMAVEKFSNGKTLDFLQTDNILQLNTGKRIKLWDNILVKRDYNKMVITHDIENDIPKLNIRLKANMDLMIADYKISVTTRVINELPDILDDCQIVLPLSFLNDGLVLRHRRPGDYFRLPDGNRKKLKDYFINSKISRDDRSTIPIVAMGSEILWIYGYRKMKINLDSMELLLLEMYNSN